MTDIESTETRQDARLAYEEYRLVGGQKGKSGVFFGVRFRDGVGMVPKVPDDIVGRMLRSDYSALPLAQALAREAAEAKPVAHLVPVEATPPPAPAAVEEDIVGAEDEAPAPKAKAKKRG